MTAPSPPAAPGRRSTREQAILAGPIVPAILRLAAPNALTVSVLSLQIVVETVYIGALGPQSLAANAYVFPFLVLMQTMSTGAMGGGVSSAVARALGARDMARARALVLHASLIAIGFAALFTVLMRGWGAAIYGAMGARGAVLDLALSYSDTLFGGVVALWLMNTLLSVVRGTGNMLLPTAVLLASAGLQMVLGYGLTQGIGPLPVLGIAGIGWATIVANGLAAAATVLFLVSRRSRVRPAIRGVRPSWPMFRDILRVGGVAIFFSLQNAVAVMALSAVIGAFGAVTVAGYGIAARLEMLQIPIVFGLGAALVPMVGMNVGAGQIARARRIALTGALLAGAITGAIGVTFALLPQAWSGLYTADPMVRAATADYLSRVGPSFAPFGFGICLYFATQGSGRILGPVLAAGARLALVLLGALAAISWGGDFIAVSWAVALAMTAYGLLAAAVLAFTRWRAPEERAAPVPTGRAAPAPP
ncbi:MAG: MATE family efflux transporter [Alphaproteobacteria bacterium]|nr:MATE family efflux transporter [Alphaproteobacteria bacterium]